MSRMPYMNRDLELIQRRSITETKIILELKEKVQRNIIKIHIFNY